MGDPMKPEGPLFIEGSLLGDLSLYANGVGGQIIINAGNDDGTWDGLVTIDGDTPVKLGPDQDPPFNSPHYQVESSILGGGSIGLAPFSINPHDTVGGNSCTNPNAPEIKLYHYGPVYRDGSGPCAKVFAMQGGVEVEVVEAGASQHDGATAEVREGGERLATQIVVGEGADGGVVRGEARGSRGEPRAGRAAHPGRVEEVDLVRRPGPLVGFGERATIVGAGGEDGGAHVAAPGGLTGGGW